MASSSGSASSGQPDGPSSAKDVSSTHQKLLEAHYLLSDNNPTEAVYNLVIAHFNGNDSIPEDQVKDFVFYLGDAFVKNAYRRFTEFMRTGGHTSPFKAVPVAQFLVCLYVADVFLEKMEQPGMTAEYIDGLQKTLGYALFIRHSSMKHAFPLALGPFIYYHHFSTTSYTYRVTLYNLAKYLSHHIPLARRLAVRVAQLVYRRIALCTDGTGPRTVQLWSRYMPVCSQLLYILGCFHKSLAPGTKEAQEGAALSIFACVRSFSLAELRYTSIPELQKLNALLENSTSPLSGADWASKHVYTNRLAVALKGTQTPILRWRLEAVDELENLVTHVTANDRNQSRWLRSTNFRRLLYDQRDTLRAIFGERMHTEVLKRCQKFLDLVVDLGLWDVPVAARVCIASIKGDEDLAVAAASTSWMGAMRSCTMLSQGKYLYDPVKRLRRERYGATAASGAGSDRVNDVALFQRSLQEAPGPGKSKESMAKSGAQTSISVDGMQLDITHDCESEDDSIAQLSGGPSVPGAAAGGGGGAESKVPSDMDRPSETSSLPAPPSAAFMVGTSKGVDEKPTEDKSSQSRALYIQAAAEAARAAAAELYREYTAEYPPKYQQTKAPTLDSYASDAATAGMYDLNEGEQSGMLKFLVTVAADCYLDYDEADHIRRLLHMHRFEADLRLAVAYGENKRQKGVARSSESGEHALRPTTLPLVRMEVGTAEWYELEAYAKASGAVYSGGCRLPARSIGEKIPPALNGLFSHLLKSLGHPTELRGQRTVFAKAKCYFLLCLYFRHVPPPAMDHRDALGFGSAGLYQALAGFPLIGAATQLDGEEYSVDKYHGNIPVEGLIGRHWGPRSQEDIVRCSALGWSDGDRRAQRPQGIGRAAEYVQYRWWADPKYLQESARADDERWCACVASRIRPSGDTSADFSGDKSASRMQETLPRKVQLPRYPSSDTTAWPLSSTSGAADEAANQLGKLQTALDFRIATPLYAMREMAQGEPGSEAGSSCGDEVADTLYHLIKTAAEAKKDPFAASFAPSVYASCLAVLTQSTDPRKALSAASLLCVLPLFPLRKGLSAALPQAWPACVSDPDRECDAELAGYYGDGSDFSDYLEKERATEQEKYPSVDCSVEGGDRVWWRSRYAFVDAILRWWDTFPRDTALEASEDESGMSESQQYRNSAATSSSSSSSGGGGGGGDAQDASGERGTASHPSGSRKRARRPSTRQAESDGAGIGERSAKVARKGSCRDARSTGPEVKSATPPVDGRLPFCTIINTISAVCCVKGKIKNDAVVGDADVDRLYRGMQDVVRATPALRAAANDALAFFCCNLLPLPSNGSLMHNDWVTYGYCKVGASPTAAVRLAQASLRDVRHHPETLSRCYLAVIRAIGPQLHCDASTAMSTTNTDMKKIRNLWNSLGGMDEYDGAGMLYLAGLRRTASGQCTVQVQPQSRHVVDLDDIEGPISDADRRLIVRGRRENTLGNAQKMCDVIVGPPFDSGPDGQTPTDEDSIPLDLLGVPLHFYVLVGAASRAVADDAVSFLCLLPRTAADGSTATATRRSLLRICVSLLYFCNENSGRCPEPASGAGEDSTRESEYISAERAALVAGGGFDSSLFGPTTTPLVRLPSSVSSMVGKTVGTSGKICHEISAFLEKCDSVGLVEDSEKISLRERSRVQAEAVILAVARASVANKYEATARLITLLRALLLQTRLAALLEVDEHGACGLHGRNCRYYPSWNKATVYRKHKILSPNFDSARWIGDALYGNSRASTALQVALARRDVYRVVARPLDTTPPFGAGDVVLGAQVESHRVLSEQPEDHVYSNLTITGSIQYPRPKEAFNQHYRLEEDAGKEFCAAILNATSLRGQKATSVGAALAVRLGAEAPPIRRAIATAAMTLGRDAASHRVKLSVTLLPPTFRGSESQLPAPKVFNIYKLNELVGNIDALLGEPESKFAYRLKQAVYVFEYRNAALGKLHSRLKAADSISLDVLLAKTTIGDVQGMICQYIGVPTMVEKKQSTCSTLSLYDMDFRATGQVVNTYQYYPSASAAEPLCASAPLRYDTLLAHAVNMQRGEYINLDLYAVVWCRDLESGFGFEFDSLKAFCESLLQQIESTEGTIERLKQISGVTALCPIMVFLHGPASCAADSLMGCAVSSDDLPRLGLRPTGGITVEGTVKPSATGFLAGLLRFPMWTEGFDAVVQNVEEDDLLAGFSSLQSQSSGLACLLASEMLGPPALLYYPLYSRVAYLLQFHAAKSWSIEEPAFGSSGRGDRARDYRSRAAGQGKGGARDTIGPLLLDAELRKSVLYYDILNAPDGDVLTGPDSADRELIESLASLRGLGGLRFCQSALGTLKIEAKTSGAGDPAAESGDGEVLPGDPKWYDRLSHPYFCKMGHCQLLQEYSDGLDDMFPMLLYMCTSNEEEPISHLALDTIFGLLPPSASITTSMVVSTDSVGGLHAPSSERDGVASDSGSSPLDTLSRIQDPVPYLATRRGHYLLESIKEASGFPAAVVLSHVSSLLAHAPSDPHGIFAIYTPLEIRRRLVANGTLQYLESVSTDAIDRVTSGDTLRSLAGLNAAMQSLLRFLELPEIAPSKPDIIKDINHLLVAPGETSDPASMLFGGLSFPEGLPDALLDTIFADSSGNLKPDSALAPSKQSGLVPGLSEASSSSSSGATAMDDSPIADESDDSAAPRSRSTIRPGWTREKRQAAVAMILGKERISRLAKISWRALLSTARGIGGSAPSPSAAAAITGAKRSRDSGYAENQSSQIDIVHDSLDRNRYGSLEDEVANTASKVLVRLLKLRKVPGADALAPGSPVADDPIISDSDIIEACRICGRISVSNTDGADADAAGSRQSLSAVGPKLLPKILLEVSSKDPVILSQMFNASLDILVHYAKRLEKAVEAFCQESDAAQTQPRQLPYLDRNFLYLVESGASKASPSSSVAYTRLCLRILRAILRCTEMQLPIADTGASSASTSGAGDSSSKGTSSSGSQASATMASAETHTDAMQSEDALGGGAIASSGAESDHALQYPNGLKLPFTESPPLASLVDPELLNIARDLRASSSYFKWLHMPQANLGDFDGKDCEEMGSVWVSRPPQEVCAMVFPVFNLLNSVLPRAVDSLTPEELELLCETIIEEYILEGKSKIIAGVQSANTRLQAVATKTAYILLAVEQTPMRVRTMFAAKITAFVQAAMDEIVYFAPTSDWTTKCDSLLSPLNGSVKGSSAKFGLVAAAVGGLAGGVDEAATSAGANPLAVVLYPASVFLRAVRGLDNPNGDISDPVTAAESRPVAALVARQQQYTYCLDHGIAADDRNSAVIGTYGTPEDCTAILKNLENLWQSSVSEAQLSVSAEAYLMQGLYPAMRSDNLSGLDAQASESTASTKASGGKEAQGSAVAAASGSMGRPAEASGGGAASPGGTTVVRGLATQLYTRKAKDYLRSLAQRESARPGVVGRFSPLAYPHPAVVGAYLGAHEGLIPSIVSSGRTTCGYAGLVNPGMHCYMLAVLQYLFMIPVLRHGTLRAKPLTSRELRKHEYPAQLLRLRWEYQKLQGMLCAAPTSAYDPHTFAQACRNIPYGWFYLDHPVEMYNDSNELLVRLVDRLGEAFPTQVGSLSDLLPVEAASGAGTDAIPAAASLAMQDLDDAVEDGDAPPQLTSAKKNLFTGTLEGKYCVELRGIDPDYPHYKSKGEYFFAVSLNIDKADDITDALAKSIEDDNLVDDNAYFCEKYDKKVDSKRKQTFAKLPPVLCLHLNRFAYNLYTYQRYKKYDRVDFPEVLDMWSYTLAGQLELEKKASALRGKESGVELDAFAQEAAKLDRLDCVYRLQGIVIHSGHADSGHYYSYILERPEDAEALQAGHPLGSTVVHPIGPGTGCRWLMFNDDYVSYVDFEDVKDDALGGKFFNSKLQKTQPRKASAFMLMYDRMSRGEAARFLAEAQDTKDDETKESEGVGAEDPPTKKRRKSTGLTSPEQLNRSISGSDDSNGQAGGSAEVSMAVSRSSGVLQPLAPLDVVHSITQAAGYIRRLQTLLHPSIPYLSRVALVVLAYASRAVAAGDVSVAPPHAGAAESRALVYLIHAYLCSLVVRGALFSLTRIPVGYDGVNRAGNEWQLAVYTLIRQLGVSPADCARIRNHSFGVLPELDKVPMKLYELHRKDMRACETAGRDFLARAAAARARADGEEEEADSSSSSGRAAAAIEQTAAEDCRSDGMAGTGSLLEKARPPVHHPPVDSASVASSAVEVVGSSSADATVYTLLHSDEGRIGQSIEILLSSMDASSCSASSSGSQVQAFRLTAESFLHDTPLATDTVCGLIGLSAWRAFYGKHGASIMFFARANSAVGRSVASIAQVLTRGLGRAMAPLMRSDGSLRAEHFLCENDTIAVLMTEKARSMLEKGELLQSIGLDQMSEARIALAHLCVASTGDRNTPGTDMKQAIVAARAICCHVGSTGAGLHQLTQTPGNLSELPDIITSCFRGHPAWRRIATYAGLPLLCMEQMCNICGSFSGLMFSSNGWPGLYQQSAEDPFVGLFNAVGKQSWYVDQNGNYINLPETQLIDLFLTSLAAGRVTDVGGFGPVPIPSSAILERKSSGDTDDSSRDAATGSDGGSVSVESVQTTDDDETGSGTGEMSKASSAAGTAETSYGYAMTVGSDPEIELHFDRTWTDRHQPHISDGGLRSVSAVARHALIAEALRLLRFAKIDQRPGEEPPQDGSEEPSGDSSATGSIDDLATLSGFSSARFKRICDKYRTFSKEARWLISLGELKHLESINLGIMYAVLDIKTTYHSVDEGFSAASYRVGPAAAQVLLEIANRGSQVDYKELGRQLLAAMLRDQSQFGQAAIRYLRVICYLSKVKATRKALLDRLELKNIESGVLQELSAVFTRFTGALNGGGAIDPADQIRPHPLYTAFLPDGEGASALPEHHPLLSLALHFTPVLARSGHCDSGLLGDTEHLALASLATWGVAGASLRHARMHVEVKNGVNQGKWPVFYNVGQLVGQADGLAGLRLIRAFGSPTGAAFLPSETQPSPYVSMLENLPHWTPIRAVQTPMGLVPSDVSVVQVDGSALLRGSLAQYPRGHAVAPSGSKKGSGKALASSYTEAPRMQKEAAEAMLGSLSSHLDSDDWSSRSKSGAASGAGDSSSSSSCLERPTGHADLSFARVDTEPLLEASKARLQRWLEPAYAPAVPVVRGKGKGKVRSRPSQNPALATRLDFLIRECIHDIKEKRRAGYELPSHRFYALSCCLFTVWYLWQSGGLEAQAWVIIFAQSDMCQQALSVIDLKKKAWRSGLHMDHVEHLYKMHDVLSGDRLGERENPDFGKAASFFAQCLAPVVEEHENGGSHADIYYKLSNAAFSTDIPTADLEHLLGSIAETAVQVAIQDSYGFDYAHDPNVTQAVGHAFGNGRGPAGGGGAYVAANPLYGHVPVQASDASPVAALYETEDEDCDDDGKPPKG